MSETQTSRGQYWLLFLVSLIAMIALLVFMTAWFWLALPFVITFLVKALDVI